ncbi:hypothetical protein ETAE_2030 [Edwardsiella piscicida]|uniref:Uncharacterized protein n=1 Tax=Edwardsiella piscicida TaxID=1263550 RepID=A0AAU8PP94_EDWPI|nr:hypothetical protein ETAE_2030 [Edwardsiella tarda EIB202]
MFVDDVIKVADIMPTFNAIRVCCNMLKTIDFLILRKKGRGICL